MKNCESKRIKYIIFLNAILFVSLIGVVTYRVYSNDVLTTAGTQYAEDMKKLEAVQKQNEQLTNIYYARTSLQSLEARALNGGYVAGNVEYVTTPALASR